MADPEPYTRGVCSLGRFGIDFWEVMGLDWSEGYPSPTPFIEDSASEGKLRPSSLKPRENFEFEGDSNGAGRIPEVLS